MFFQGQTLIWTHLRNCCSSIDVKRRGSASVGYWVYYVTFTFFLTSLKTLTLDVSRSNFEIVVPQGLLVWLIHVKWKGSKLIGYWADFMTLPFDHTYDLDLEVSTRSEFEIVWSQKWDGWLTWNENDARRPFMIVILTLVWPHGEVCGCTG